MLVLVTRPAEDGQRTVQALTELGHRTILSPVTVIEAVDAPPPTGPFDAIALTSTNALRRLPALRTGLPVFAVGERTAKAARAAGFTDVTMAEQGAEALAALVCARLSAPSRILYPAGEPRTPALEQALDAAGFRVSVWLRYRSLAAAGLSDEAVAALRAGTLGAILHYSRESAGRFAALAIDAGLGAAAARPRHACMSAYVAAGLAPLAPENLAIAARPKETALFALLDKDH